MVPLIVPVDDLDQLRAALPELAKAYVMVQGVLALAANDPHPPVEEVLDNIREVFLGYNESILDRMTPEDRARIEDPCRTDVYRLADYGTRSKKTG